VPDEVLRDRVVLLGTSAESVKDEHATPVGTLSGVELHALLAEQLLRFAGGGVSISAASVGVESSLVVGLGLFAALLAVAVRSPLLLGVLSAAGLAAVAVAARVGFERGFWLPAAPLGLAWVVAGGAVVAALSFRERAERGRVMELFGRFLSPDLADEIWKRKDEFMHGGRPRAQRATVTVLVSDLEGYTAAVEKLEPEVLMEWANGYLDGLASVVGRYRGLVDDYAGDGIKADFGVPIPREAESEIAADAEAAVACAIEMGHEVERLNHRSRAQSLPTARLRIGIVTGPAVLGMIGSAHRLKYTTVGDTVNTAARLEGFDKEGFAREPVDRVVRILVGESTRVRLGPRFVCEEIGEIQLKGRSEAMRAHRVWPPKAVEGRLP
jgi:adenylate cyclase